MFSAKPQDPIAGFLRRLFRWHDVPKIDARKQFPKIVRSGSSVRWIVAGNDKRRHVDAHQFFRLGAGRRVTVEHTPTGGGNDPEIPLQLLRAESISKGIVPCD